MSALPLLALLLLGAADDAPPLLPEVGATLQQAGGARIVSAVLPARIGDFALPAGRRTLALRVDPEEGASRVFLLDLEAPPRSVEMELREIDLPELSAAGPLLTADLDGDGTEELLLATADRILALDGEGAPRTLLQQGLHALPRSALPPAASPRAPLGLLEPGRFTPLRIAAGTLAAAAPFDLPLHARRRSSGLLLETPPVTALPRPGASPLYLVGPEAHGQRLRTLLLDPDAPEEERVAESWALLPGPEKVGSSAYALLGDRLRLVVLTTRSDKLEIFGKQKLRVFSVAPDRTRGGRGALHRSETETINWNEIGLTVADVDGDGTQELVVLQPEGLGAGDLVVEAWSQGPSWGFAPRPRRSKLGDLEGCWVYGEDLDGDRLPDLAVWDETLDLYSGNGARKKRSVLAEKPSRSLDLPSETGPRATTVSLGSTGSEVEHEQGCEIHLLPRPDGPAELLLVSHHGERGRVRVVRFE